MKTLFAKILLVFLMAFSSLVSISQELNCNVQVNSTQVQGSDKSVFDAMQKSIFEFIELK